MVFSSALFLFIFLPVTLLGYYASPGKIRNYWLLGMSFLFFGWMQPWYLWVIVLNIVINFLGALLTDRYRKHKRLFLASAVALNLLVLFFFKYLEFSIVTINGIFGSTIPVVRILLPIGISFFTFQGMSYVFDVSRGYVKVQKNIFKVALFIVLFPQLIAGPIVRYKDIAHEIDHRRFQAEDFSSGIERFIIGLAKKAIIANSLAAVADAIWANGAGQSTWPIAWIGSLAYTLQIYFDFSGYSDMAIGLGRMFGFHFTENFRLPYISGTITEFWRRWHISLSSWFKDYVYIPLGGNRKHVYFNLLVVFLLTGIWHGASWNFVLWGLWNCAFILIERMIRTRAKNRDFLIRPGADDGGVFANAKKEESLFFGTGVFYGANRALKEKMLCTVFTKLYTLFVVHVGWVLFRAPNIREAWLFLLSMFGATNAERVGFTAGWFLDGWTVTVFLSGILAASSLPARVWALLKKHVPETGLRIGKYAALLVLFYISVMQIISGTYNPFIYFRF